LFTVVAEPELDGALAFLRSVRDAAGVRDQTKLYVAPIDEVN
jgi:hypothetical protein